MAKGTKKKRIRSPHPGVYIFKRKHPSGRTTWRGKYIDPKTELWVFVSLDRLKKTNDDLRKEWATNKSKEISNLRNKLESGEPVATEETLTKAVKDFYERKGAELRQSTVVVYKEGITFFTDWCAKSGINKTTELTGPALARFRSALVSRKKMVPKKGGERGKFKRSREQRSPSSSNKDMQSVRAFLNDLRRMGYFKYLNSDQIRDSLRAMKKPMPLLDFLRPKEIQGVFSAALAHDAETFALTREEKARKLVKGSTPRYTPVAGFIATLLLTGGRFAEIAELRWDEVDLDEGAIELAANRTKTNQARRIDLAITPHLKALLAKMKLQRGEKDAYVFGGKKPLNRALAQANLKRVVKKYEAPEFNWQKLRKTCGTYLTCAPGIYGAASAWLSAKRLGHGVAVAEKHYAGALTSIPLEAKTLEAAMGIEDLMGCMVGEEQAAKAITA